MELLSADTLWTVTVVARRVDGSLVAIATATINGARVSEYPGVTVVSTGRVLREDQIVLPLKEKTSPTMLNSETTTSIIHSPREGSAGLPKVGTRKEDGKGKSAWPSGSRVV